MIAPSRICARNSASTTQKYFAVARIDGVIRSSANGSLAGRRMRLLRRGRG